MSAAEGEEQVAESPNVDFTPVVQLPMVETKTLEEDEDEMFKIRARLFRYASECSPPEWKERGTGDVRLLKKEGRRVRLVMRRDKTLKICANHYITSRMELRPNKGSDRAWLYTTLCDFADEESKTETLAIRFANSNNAQLFKTAFESAQEIARKIEGTEGEENDDEGDDDSDSDKDEEPAAEEKKEEASKPEDGSADKEEAAAQPSEDKSAEEVTEKMKEMAVEDTKTEEPATTAEGGEGQES